MKSMLALNVHSAQSIRKLFRPLPARSVKTELYSKHGCHMPDRTVKE